MTLANYDGIGVRLTLLKEEMKDILKRGNTIDAKLVDFLIDSYASMEKIIFPRFIEGNKCEFTFFYRDKDYVDKILQVAEVCVLNRKLLLPEYGILEELGTSKIEVRNKSPREAAIFLLDKAGIDYICEVEGEKNVFEEIMEEDTDEPDNEAGL